MSTAREVITAALIAELPGDRVDVDRRAALIEEALIEHGHLPRPSAEPTVSEVEEVAQWLARESRHPRYTTGEGWRRILQSTADVGVATAAAQGHVRTRAGEEQVAMAEHVLTQWITAGGGR